jgi:hypothetical protein
VTSSALPRPAPDVIEDGIPATDEVSAEQLTTHDVAEGPMPPLDEPQAVEDWGVTRREARAGEPLSVRLRREEPDRSARVEDDVSQLLEPGAELWVDVEPSAVAELDGRWEDTLSAEEAAVHIVDEPSGLTFDEGPGYLETWPGDDRQE